MSGYSVQIGGNSVTTLAGSLQIAMSIGRRSTASFIVRTPTPQHFQQYQQVAVYDASGILVFSGYISSPKEQMPGFSGALIHTITCIDQHWIADKRLVAASYVNKTCGYIVQDLLNAILASEGVTVGQIYDGVTPSTTLYPSLTLYPGGNIGLIPSANFAYCTVAVALDALVTEASASGIPYYWAIDQNKQLWFVPYTAIVNTTLVDGSQINPHMAPIVTRANPTYRNTQYVTGGVTQTVTQNETRHGDGVIVAWPMSFALASVPTVTLNAVAQTVGILGVSTGKNFYWQQNSPLITQDNAGTKLISTDTLAITYIGQYPSTQITQDASQIAYQASLDGTTGIVEEIIADATLADASSALTLASSLLTRYAQQGLTFTFSTRQTGFAPGQWITVNLPVHGINNAQLLIETVNIADSDNLNIWNTVVCIQGPSDISWQYFFSKLLLRSQPANIINIGVTTTTSIQVTFNATITDTMSFTAASYVCPVVGPSLLPSLTLFPC